MNLLFVLRSHSIAPASLSSAFLPSSLDLLDLLDLLFLLDLLDLLEWDRGRSYSTCTGCASVVILRLAV